MRPEQSAPSTVFGLAAYNGEEHLAEALESLLGQTRGDFAIVVADDCSSDGTRAIALRYADLDPRVVYERNDRQLGLVRNWRRAFDLARDQFPAARYFAWASDHDVWDPRWLELLADELDAHPGAVLAYPLGVRIDDFGAEYPTRLHMFDTASLGVPAERVRRTTRELTAAGELIYGLARRSALERCGAFPLVVLPDRLHLVRLSVEGEFRQVERRLWYRRHRAGVSMSNSRQRRASFPEGAPLWAHLPWWLSHTRIFVRSLDGNPERVRLARIFLGQSLRHARERRRARVRRQRRWRRRHYRNLVLSALRRVRGAAAAGQTAEVPPAERLVGQDRPAVGEALAVMGQAGLLEDLALPGAVVVELGNAQPSGLGEELQARFPGLVHIVHSPGELGSAELGRIDLAVSVRAFEQLPEEELDACVARLHELGAPFLYSVDRESEALRAALRRWYWLRDLWVPARWKEDGCGRKPDPVRGPVPRRPGTYRHIVGRRRLLPGNGSVPARS